MKLRHIVPVAISALVPGFGHLVAGRPGRGVLLFFLFGFAIDGLLYSHVQSLLPPQEAALPPLNIRNASLALGAALWLIALADVIAIEMRKRRIESKAGEATEYIRQALVASLCDDWRAAARALHAALRINPRDADALFHIGAVYAASGHRRKARRALHRCIRSDHDGKWDKQAAEQLDALDTTRQPAKLRSAKPEKDDQGETRA